MNFKILIVEDEEIIRLGLQDNFEMEGYTVETACDGEEAIAKADSYQPHLVLLDLMIPKKSGFEVCRYIRNKHPDTYIIMLTAKTEETSKVAGLEMGADDYVTKPFSILELLARVKAFRRRIEPQSGSTSVQVPEVLEFANIKINVKSVVVNIHKFIKNIFFLQIKQLGSHSRLHITVITTTHFTDNFGDMNF